MRGMRVAWRACVCLRPIKPTSLYQTKKGITYERNTFNISLMIFFSSLYLALRSSTKNLNKSSGVDPKKVAIVTKRQQQRQVINII